MYLASSKEPKKDLNFGVKRGRNANFLLDDFSKRIVLLRFQGGIDFQVFTSGAAQFVIFSI